jgi:HAE1 family hydrophobic/amphiphilic exporter-1
MSKKQSSSRFAAVSSFFFTRWQASLLLFVFLIGSGVLVYSNIIKREGFPPIQFPLSVVTGAYFVDDQERVDSELAQPFYEVVSEVPGVSEVTTSAGPNFFQSFVFFESDINAEDGTKSVQEAISASSLPDQAKSTLQVISLDPAAYLNEFDMLLSVYSVEPVSLERLEEVSDYVAQSFSRDPLITDAKPQSVFTEAENPQTGQIEKRQTAFNQIGLRDNGELDFFTAVSVGVNRDEEKIDVLELSELASSKIAELDLSQFGDSFRVVIGADFAKSITTQISSLQSNLLSGLIAVAVVSFLLITWRASIITAIFIVSVMSVSVLVLYVIGYTLNTITLFALVLSLGLFVDDATIVVESIYANRSKKKKPLEVVRTAIGKIGSASFAGTFTTVLVFLPLAFIGGILGEFIRLMPITIIISLVVSLVLSLTLIPVLAKFILLKKEKSGWLTTHNPIVKLEQWLGNKAGSAPRLLKSKPTKGKIVLVSFVALSIVAILGSGMYANKVSFNIFPPTKDSDQIGFQITYPAGYSIEQAEAVANQINDTIKETIEPQTVRVLYGGFEQPSNRSADAVIELISFTERDIKSPELLASLQSAINETVPGEVSVRVIQYDAGPPAAEFPLTIQIIEEDIDKASVLALEVQEYIDGAIIERSNGTTAKIIETRAPSLQSVDRNDGRRTLVVSGAFDADDTSALLVAAEAYVQEKFTPEYLVEGGYSEDTIGFDFGQESENAESFAGLIIAFPVALLLMYMLLATQFRSFLQPLLIFMAIPFTFLGVFAGLYYTDNALSFFVQVGLIGLIGIAVNNTILLTTYANQEKLAGEGTIDAISNAVTKRFRPLIATTITTVAALLPLALSDPFWEALAFTIIFGLLSSTFLVIVSFPYYYLGAEWLRMRLSKGTRKARKAAKQKNKK